MIEVRKPDALNANNFYGAMDLINTGALKSVERREKGKPADHYIAKWDETVITAPTDQEMLDSEVIFIANQQAKDDAIASKRADQVTLSAEKGQTNRGLPALNDTVNKLINIVEQLEK